MPFVHSVFHPSDFSADSANAFAHALAIALVRRTEFAILHAGRDDFPEDEWTRFPPVRATLERWRLLEKGRPRSAVFDALAVRVKKVSLRSLRPFAAALDYLERFFAGACGHPLPDIGSAGDGFPVSSQRLVRYLREAAPHVIQASPSGFQGIGLGEYVQEPGFHATERDLAGL